MARLAAKRESDAQVFEIAPFLTAFDPSDLPGSSVDPLGFDRGYNFLADKVLPGLTNVGRKPRYFSLLCAGATLPDLTPDVVERRQYEERLGCVLRLERLWVLANLLASGSDTELPPQGLRGAQYGRAHLQRLEKRRTSRTGTDFELLVRQAPYGVVGIYGRVAEGMRLLQRRALNLTPGLGERLGGAFLEETDAPSAVLRAARDSTAEVDLSTLEEWGRRAHIAVPPRSREAECLHEALHGHPVRSRMALLLQQVPRQGGESELQRLRRIAKALTKRNEDADLLDGLRVIEAFEACYRGALLGFERLLWLAKQSEVHRVSLEQVDSDGHLRAAAQRYPQLVELLEHVLTHARTEAFRVDLERLNDLRQLLQSLAAASRVDGSPGWVTTLVGRHTDVQRGKLDHGRPKLPWVEQRARGFELTLTRVGEVDQEPRTLEDLAPHEYRTASADALLQASTEVRS